MLNRGGLIHLTTQTAEPTTIGGVTLTPRSRVLTIRLPFGGFVWQRPIGVSVRRGDHTDELPIRDLTRIVQLLCTGAVVLTVLVTRAMRQRKTEAHH